MHTIMQYYYYNNVYDEFKEYNIIICLVYVIIVISLVRRSEMLRRYTTRICTCILLTQSYNVVGTVFVQNVFLNVTCDFRLIIICRLTETHYNLLVVPLADTVGFLANYYNRDCLFAVLFAKNRSHPMISM